MARKDCAARLKEKQLFEMFPTINQNFLMDIFKDNKWEIFKYFLCKMLHSNNIQYKYYIVCLMFKGTMSIYSSWFFKVTFLTVGYKFPEAWKWNLFSSRNYFLSHTYAHDCCCSVGRECWTIVYDYFFLNEHFCLKCTQRIPWPLQREIKFSFDSTNLSSVCPF